MFLNKFALTFNIFNLIVGVLSQDVSSLVDTKTLSELPLEKLLKVQNTFKDDPLEVAENQPQALALHGKPKPNPDRGGYYGHGHIYEEEYYKKSGKKSVQSIFQLSVTTLAFLAFGGYLLCLLVQAIRAKDVANSMNMVMGGTPTVAALLRPRPIRRRPTRRPIKFQRPNRRPGQRPKREAFNLAEVDSESMYFALVSLSEAYANYHTIDYKKFNYTTRNYG